MAAAHDNSCNVVVIGGNFGGLSIGHHLLRNVLPKLSSSTAQHKLTLVTPNTHALWKVGVPRAVINQKVKPIDDLFLSIHDAFRSYGSSFELVQGVAVGIDEVAKAVSIKLGSGKPDVQVIYDALVICTGTSSNSPLWTLQDGGHEATVRSIQEIRSSLRDAQTILIGGGGPAGVETAGEIAYNFPGRQITLLSGTDRVLKKLRVSLSHEAVQHLNKLGVQVRHNVKVEEASKEGSKTSLRLSDGTTATFDVYIDATGGRPNSSFIPSTWLTATGYVKTEEPTLRVLGTHGVYCIGDVASYSRHSIYETTEPVRALGFSLWEDFKTDDSMSMKPVKYHHDTREFLIVPIGPKGGVGAYYGWKLPSTLIWGFKGRTFLWELFRPMVQGDSY